jgi:hypothetical protein
MQSVLFGQPGRGYSQPAKAINVHSPSSTLTCVDCPSLYAISTVRAAREELLTTCCEQDSNHDHAAESDCNGAHEFQAIKLVALLPIQTLNLELVVKAFHRVVETSHLEVVLDARILLRLLFSLGSNFGRSRCCEVGKSFFSVGADRSLEMRNEIIVVSCDFGREFVVVGGRWRGWDGWDLESQVVQARVGLESRTRSTGRQLRDWFVHGGSVAYEDVVRSVGVVFESRRSRS